VGNMGSQRYAEESTTGEVPDYMKDALRISLRQRCAFQTP